jgi:beta-barrel assembly-enhancing protease
MNVMNEPNQNFKAFLVQPDLGTEAMDGRISVDRRRLLFLSEALESEIPLERLVVKLGRGDDSRVYFWDQRHPGVTIFTEDDSVLECVPLLQSNHVRRQLEAILTRREVGRRLRITLYCLAACALAACVVSLATGAMVRSLAADVPPQWEKTFGDEQIQELRTNLVFVDNSNQVVRLAELAAPLLQTVPTRGTRFQFHIVESVYPNAFALPGGHIVITTSLLQLVDRPEELLGVIAHEMAHITRHHHARKIISAAGPLVIFGIFFHSRDQTLDVLSSGSGLLVTRGFSQEYELEADDFGWNYLMAANVDPRGMIDLFKKFKAIDAQHRAGGLLPQAFSSHPALDKRISRLESRWNKLPDKSGFRQLAPLDIQRH